MLHRKIYQLYQEGREVCIFLRDQQRWIESGQIIDFEGDLVTIRYETEEDDEVSSWEEMVRLESIGAVTQKLASVPKIHSEIYVSDDCPEAEQIHPRSAESDRD
jgi:ASC-1-like (ASCH) protein